MTSLERITDRLARAKVDFILCGGLAALLHGSSLLTRDVDVVCPMDSENLERIFEALAELNPCHRMTPQRLPFTLDQARAGGLKNLYLATDWGQLDCLGEIKGLGSFQDCLPLSQSLRISGLEIRTLTLDALITSKQAMGRPRDLHAVLELEALRLNSPN
jgi:hypothetical protein